MSTFRKVLVKLQLEGFSFMVGSDGETDYSGNSADQAYVYAMDLDPALVRIVKDGQVKDCILFVPSLDDDEQIADCLCDGPVQFVLDSMEG